MWCRGAEKVFSRRQVQDDCWDLQNERDSGHQGIIITRGLFISFFQKYAATQQLIYAKAVRQYRYWIANMYDNLSFFVNFVVGLCDLTDDDPTVEKFEEWAIYKNEKYNTVTTFETNV